ncbi:MAG: DUF3313 family protein [Halioglobus sp.]
MFRFATAILLASALALTASTALGQKTKKKDFSGWMENYESLVYDQERNAFLFSNEKKRGHYEKVRLVDVTIYGEGMETDGKFAQQAADYLRDGVNRIFEEKDILATEAGPKVAKLSLAITGVKKTKESLKAHNLIPVSAVFRGAKAATGNIDTYIDVMFEGEATDSVTGERVMAIVTRGIGTTDKKSGDDLVFEDLIPTLDRWLENYRQTLNEFMANRE